MKPSGPSATGSIKSSRRLVKWESTDESQTGIAASPGRGALSDSAFGRPFARGETDAHGAGENVLRYLCDKAKPIYDPFCGGGSIPLEAQRLGLRAVGSDLNPVAVLITKALIELPHKFRNQPPGQPGSRPRGNDRRQGP